VVVWVVSLVVVSFLSHCWCVLVVVLAFGQTSPVSAVWKCGLGGQAIDWVWLGGLRAMNHCLRVG